MPSSVIRHYRYDADQRRLVVVFQSGRGYAYLGVPADVAAALRSAFSKGEYFNAHIRDQYRFERLAE